MVFFPSFIQASVTNIFLQSTSLTIYTLHLVQSHLIFSFLFYSSNAIQKPYIFHLLMIFKLDLLILSSIYIQHALYLISSAQSFLVFLNHYILCFLFLLPISGLILTLSFILFVYSLKTLVSIFFAAHIFFLDISPTHSFTLIHLTSDKTSKSQMIIYDSRGVVEETERSQKKKLSSADL